ncbi:2-phosphosulfolactate phosphatase [Bacillus benzoevorans]|uniref:Probable 2-phosphosulfolactate phosphatase n=1 Tax=Bacillus benzoevorans TaxID=1456 RepID=A0A7X0HTJ2_9BACI|nr:2-phosphosulfolactate phosphatase [Bacillus benzoevorans]MBB6446595.1 2-phosphosulfolactate phosphatase [Bacillus benzoevorans]
MVKIHVLTQKEMINPLKIKNCTAVIFDVLLATTTITTLFQYGAKKIIPVLNVEEALEVSQELSEYSYILCGEKKGLKVENFLYPCPLELKKKNILDKTIILSTTNGTVALNHSFPASFIYASCFLNNHYMADHLLQNHSEKTILLVCAGNHGNFSMEDFLGTGHLIQEFYRNAGDEENIHLSDSGAAAYHFYRQLHEKQMMNYFLTSQTGKLLTSLGYRDSIYHAFQRDMYEVIPILRKGKYPYLENLQIAEKTPVY